MSCAEFGDSAAELALGVLTGRERARALAHLDHCDACRENVRQLAVTGEELVGLLPAIEPPAGFETRVMERLGLGSPVPSPVQPSPAPRLSPARRFGRKLAGWLGGGWTGRSAVGYPRRLLVAAAVAVAVIVGGVGGWGLHAATSSPAASPLSSAPLLTASHQTAGEVYLYDSGSRWLYMSVDFPYSSGAVGNDTVLCQVEDQDGHLTTIGSFKLTDGYGYWGSPDPETSGTITGARLVTTTGTVLATAAFS